MVLPTHVTDHYPNLFLFWEEIDHLGSFGLPPLLTLLIFSIKGLLLANAILAETSGKPRLPVKGVAPHAYRE